MKKNNLFVLSLVFLMPLLLFAKKESPETLKKAESTLPPQCIFYFKMYLHAQGPKAFSYAVDSKEKVTCRFSAAAKNQTRANEVALSSCKKSSLEKGIVSSCKLYHSDAHLTKSQRTLSFEEKYLLNLKNIKKEIFHPKNRTKPQESKKPSKKIAKKTVVKTRQKLPQKCMMFYHLYEEAKEHKAFAIAVDNDTRYTCKYSAGSNSAKKAEEVALKSCEKSRKKRTIKQPCQLFTLTKDSPKKKVIQKKVVDKEVPQKKPIVKTTILPQSNSTKALKKAILATNLNKIKKLIKAGADINTETSDKSRSLFVAVAQGDIAFAKELLKKGAFVFIKKRNGNNLLVAAIMSGDNKMLRLMLEQKINPNIRCEEGNTPLHLALMMFDRKMMKTLYTFGARDDVKNNKEKTVKDLAKEFRLNLKRIKR